MKKRLLALLMTAAMALSLMPMSVLAVDSDDQIVSNGQEVITGNDKVKHSKIIEQTGENQFDITLTVQTKEDIQSQSASMDAAVVLVMDVSSSMTSSDMSSARSAAKGFVDAFVKEAGNATRQVAVVQFGSNAQTVLDWTEANGHVSAVKTGIDQIHNKFSYTVSCSEAGSHTHVERIQADPAVDIEYRASSGHSYNHGGPGNDWDVDHDRPGQNWGDGNHKPNQGGWYCLYCGERVSRNGENERPTHLEHSCQREMSYEGAHALGTHHDSGGTNMEGGLRLAYNLLRDDAVDGIDNTYVVLLTDGVPTFHVADADETDSTEFMKGTEGGSNKAEHSDYHDIHCSKDSGDNVPGMIKSLGTKLYTVSYKHTNDKVNGQEINAWLTAFSTQSVHAGDDIFAGLASIAQIIVNQAQAWILTDPMGQFITFGENSDIARVNALSRDSSDAVRKFDTSSNTLIWDLKSDITRTGPENGWYTYTLTYSVILDNLASGFEANKDYAANGTTTLTYMLTEDGVLQPDLKETQLVVPVVKGLAGDLSFTKQTQDGQPLAGAEFTLATGNWTRTAVSDEDGAVVFSDVPSGHSYTLAETKAPDGYEAVAPMPVTVTKGQVSPVGENGVLVDPAITNLTFEKEADKTVATPGDTIAYKITVTNNGKASVSGIPVYDEVPEGLTDVSAISHGGNLEDGVITWTVAKLDAGASQELTFKVKIPENAADGAVYKNTAVVDGDKTNEVTTTVDIPEPPAAPVVTAVKIVSDNSVEPGDVITYTIKVENKGNAPAENVAVTDEVPAGLSDVSEISHEGNLEDSTITWTIAKLDAGASQELTFKVKIPENAADGAVYKNTAVVDGDKTNEVTTTVDIPEPPAAPVITAVKTVNDTTVEPGDLITYTIKVENKGNAPAENVAVTDAVPAGLSDVSEISHEGNLEDGVISWTIAKLDAGASEELTFKVKIPENAADGAVYKNTAVVDGDKTNEVTTTVDIPEPPAAPVVTAVKTVSDTTVEPGDVITYTITVKNTGTAASETITVADTVPKGLTPYDISDNGAMKRGVITWTVESLDPGESERLTFKAKIPEDAADKTVYRNTAVVNGENTNTTKTTVGIPEIPVLNTEDHYAYIIGYPVDYYTGKKTSDQTRMPVKPQGNITRAEVATIFFRMLTDESRNEFWSITNSYSDVSQNQWFNNAISTLSNAGIITGYKNGTFDPNGYITRAEFAAIASRFFDTTYQGKDLFPDIDGHWAAAYINKAAQQGIVNGYPDGTFRPQQLITRAEAMAMVNRTLDRAPDKDHFLPDMLVWVDNRDTNKWYYEDVQEATNSHEYVMHTKAGGKYEVWMEMLPVRDWAAFEKAWADANAANGGEVVK